MMVCVSEESGEECNGLHSLYPFIVIRNGCLCSLRDTSTLLYSAAITRSYLRYQPQNTIQN